MNEKIRELMMKATKDMPETYYWPGQYVEKFAELIVRECAELTSRYQMGTTRLPNIIVSYNYSDKLEDVLKKHFGVEE
ncbi:hypothetical protein UFOVP181_38 [uncultured Caudovirales phage]|uniref:Uncharacterized protein n=1 Tax=uncultured Caudovirales phage TaxID=2100421 RepID=A0A6J5KVN8_9CAUD|nr:hypothetical protein UFOVP57_124 [uncultured Caudovirales phage]CAB5208473.1 hypothetical protein UFOVP181_38 [uncultured Caudovirales phage]